MEVPASLFLRKLAEIEPEKLRQIKGLGPIMVENLQKFTQSTAYQILLEKFQDLESQKQGLAIKLSVIQLHNSKSKKLGIVCITGTFELPRIQISQQLEQKGYQVVSSLTKEVTVLVAGDKAGSKLSKAEQMGLKIIKNWQDLL